MHRLSNDAKLAYPDNPHAFGASPFLRGNILQPKLQSCLHKARFLSWTFVSHHRRDFLTTPGGTI